MRTYFTVPNILSASRIAIFPLLIYFALTQQKSPFSWLLLFSLVTDVADGYIARRFNMITPFGSRLDSWGDACNYIAALTGIINLCWHDVVMHAFGFIIIFGLYFLQMGVMLLRYKKLIGMHLYISKITGYVHGFFILFWFLFSFNEWLFALAVCIACYAFIEEMILTVMLKRPDSDLKSVYHVFKYRKDLLK